MKADVAYRRFYAPSIAERDEMEIVDRFWAV